MYPYAERLNNVAVESATGERYVIDEGPTRVNASITWNAIHYDVVKEYEKFLLEYARLGLNPFRIVCPDYIDFGEGMGADIEAAYYAGPPALRDIITPRGDAGLYYDIELPYMFVRIEEDA
jgi:hypothetical protein